MQRPRAVRLRQGRRPVALAVAAAVLLTMLTGPGAWAQEQPPSPLIRVGLGRSLQTGQVAAEGELRVLDAAGNGLAAVAPGRPLQFALAGDGAGGPGIRLILPGGEVRGPYPGPLRLVTGPGPDGSPRFLIWNSRRYRGELEIRVSQKDGRLSLINILPLEEYLRGVVTKEMPASWPAEALKAQAVVARTYALYTRQEGRFRPEGFDVTDDTQSQVYLGVDGETPAGDAAVAATAGQVLTYGGALAAAVYHASAGGHTEDVEVIWGTPWPYLRGVPSPDGNHTAYFAWARELTAAEVAAALRQAGTAADIGEVVAVEPAGVRGTGGRWSHWVFYGTRGQVRLSAEQVRAVLRLPAPAREVVALEVRQDLRRREYAPAETVTVLGAGGRTATVPIGQAAVTGSLSAPPRTAAGPPVVVTGATAALAGRFQVRGGGHGHGVGMSQWGARAMAEAGKTYVEILTHYYPGVQVTTLTQP